MSMLLSLSQWVVVGVMSVTLATMPTSLWHGGVATLGPLSLGNESPLGPGAMTFAPELRVPPSRFYIGIAEKSAWCVFDECAPVGAQVGAVGGWLQSEDTDQWATREDFGLQGDTRFSSVVVIANAKGNLVGIYPDKTIKDVDRLLHIHRKLWQ